MKHVCNKIYSQASTINIFVNLSIRQEVKLYEFVLVQRQIKPVRSIKNHH